jgi:hypothetical protein
MKMTKTEKKLSSRFEAQRSRSRWWTLRSIFVVATVFNYAWELAQSPLYRGMGSLDQVWWHCFLASLGDGLLVLLIFAAGWMALHRRDWLVRPGVHGYAVMLATGLVISVSIEWIAVHVVGRWAYTERMPLVPGLNVGILPIAQMLILPPLIFRVTSVWCRIRHSSRARLSPGRSRKT